MSTVAIDDALWRDLHAHACAAAARAYAPYSKYPVGAAALVDDGRIITGCNVENSSYGIGLCAECGLISTLINGGGGRLRAFLCVNRDGDVIVPCGRCRQLLHEHGGDELELQIPAGHTTMGQFLPGAFRSEDLTTVCQREALHKEQS